MPRKNTAREKLVVALGGNALVAPRKPATVSTQFRNLGRALEGVAALAKKGYRLALTHGNGPQVGNILLRVEEARGIAYDLPLNLCVAESEGEIGYMIEQTLQNKLKARGVKREVVTILTQSLVSAHDTAFRKPSKPIGPFYGKRDLPRLLKKHASFIEDAGRGYRRVVASPKPVDIVEANVIRRLVDAGVIVVAAGGGGMPVVRRGKKLVGVEGVVDKDFASAVLAQQIGAKELLVLTGVDCVYKNFGKKNQEAIRAMTVKGAKALLKEGHFGKGSMQPKVEAALQFLRGGGKRVVITSIARAGKALAGQAGTAIKK